MSTSTGRGFEEETALTTMRTKELTRGLTREIHASTKGADEDGMVSGTPEEMAPVVDMDVEEEAIVASGMDVCVACGGPAGAFSLPGQATTLKNDAPCRKEDVEALAWSGKRLSGDAFYEVICAQ